VRQSKRLTLWFVGSGLVALGALGSAYASESPPKSQRPADWIGTDGRLVESRVPARVGISTELAKQGVGYIDPRLFYAPSDASSAKIPVYESLTGAAVIGSYDPAVGAVFAPGATRADIQREPRTTVQAEVQP